MSVIKFEDSTGRTQFILRDEDKEPMSVNSEVKSELEEEVCPRQDSSAPCSTTPH